MTVSLVYDLIILLAAGLVAALICRRLNVSVLIGYLVVGTVIGHGVLGWVQDEQHQLAHFAEVGVFLLLFTIGLEFAIDDIKRLGKNLLIGGGLQMLLVATPIIGLLCSRGMAWQPALLMAAAAAFSSTVLVFRALSECGHAQTAHGRRAIGILLFQDAALVPLLLVVPLLTGHDNATNPFQLLLLTASSFAFIAGIVLLRLVLSEWIIPKLANYRSSELVVLFTIVSLGSITLAAYAIGLPPAIGAFAAGLVFNGNRWSHQIDALVLPFRETFAAVFFVGLGLIFDPRLLWQEPQLILLALPAMLLLKATAASLALRFTGLSSKSAIGMGLGLAQVGEFAFVLVLLGVDSGLLAEADYQRIVAIAVGSLILTPALMKLGLRFVQLETEEVNSLNGRSSPSLTQRAIVIGAGPIGHSIASQLELLGKEVCIVDLSPINLHPFAQQGFQTVAGNAAEENVLVLAGVRGVSLIVVCVPEDGSATRIVKKARGLDSDCSILVRCRYRSRIAKLKKAGADEVVAEENEAALALLGRLSKLEPAKLPDS